MALRKQDLIKALEKFPADIDVHVGGHSGPIEKIVLAQYDVPAKDKRKKPVSVQLLVLTAGE